MPHVNKKTITEKWNFGSNKKLGLEWTMNGLEKPFKKIRYKKLKKQLKKSKWNCRVWTKNHYRET